MPKPKMSDSEKNMTALISELHGRICRLEDGPRIEAISKLSLSPGDIVVVKSVKVLDEEVLTKLSAGITKEVGFGVAVINSTGGNEIGVFKRVML
jgi:hypothetical protein